MVTASRSASFGDARYLTERLPVDGHTPLGENLIPPISVRDVLRYLVGCAARATSVDRAFDIGGRDVLTYRAMMHRYAEIAGLSRRRIIPVPVLSPRSCPASGSGLVTPVPSSLARPLVESLKHEVVCAERDIERYVASPADGSLGLHAFRRAGAEQDPGPAGADPLVVGVDARSTQRAAADRSRLGRRRPLRRRTAA
jgi:hypothetical protein